MLEWTKANKPTRLMSLMSFDDARKRTVMQLFGAGVYTRKSPKGPVDDTAVLRRNLLNVLYFVIDY